MKNVQKLRAAYDGMCDGSDFENEIDYELQELDRIICRIEGKARDWNGRVEDYDTEYELATDR